MKLTDEEAQYLDCLARGMTFEEMAVELGWTPQKVEDFGDNFFDRVFAERKKTIV